MDVILKCYFDQFERLPRNSLHDRRKRRQTVEYINTIIEECNRGENSDTQKTARDAVNSIVRYHEVMRNSNGRICLMGKYHNVLYVALKICFDWQLKDSSTIATVLEHIYACESTFERIFAGAIFGTKAPFYLTGWKSDFIDQEENIRAMVFFLEHANVAGLEFSYNKYGIMRFVDIPIESCGRVTPLMMCIQLGLPDLVQILLRFGASIRPIMYKYPQMDIIEDIMIRLTDRKDDYPCNLVACMQLLLRIVPSVDIGLIELFSCEGITPRKYLLANYVCLLEDGIIPITRCGIQTPELKHLCRCVIRKRLKDNFQLPNGINELKVPLTLTRYLDIKID